MPYADPKVSRAAAARRQKKYRRANPATAKRANYNARYRRTYGITHDEKIALLQQQGNVCASCGSATPGHVRGWHTDHDHQTGVVRGVLCLPCNVILGLASDSVDHLSKCISYLARMRP